jgi:hypothetical protein
MKGIGEHREGIVARTVGAEFDLKRPKGSQAVLVCSVENHAHMIVVEKKPRSNASAVITCQVPNVGPPMYDA